MAKLLRNEFKGFSVGRNMKNLMLVIATALLLTAPLRAEQFIVKDGKANAEIITAEQPIRVVELAAEQLQEYIEKMSKAKLPVTSLPDNNIPLKLYVGKSKHTEALGIDGDQFLHGGFRIASGKGWLALVGRDRNFAPPKIWPEKETDFPKEYEEWDKVYEEWDKATGEKFGYPYRVLWKEYHRELKIFEKDERGSFNAVVYFLRSLGVRWYLPDELGEVVPEAETIIIPEIDKKIIPDFPVRMPMQWARRFNSSRTTKAEALWQWRLGWSQAPEVVGYGYSSHGINEVASRDETKKEHPEYYALYGGKRETSFRNAGKPCLSSEGLFKANVRYAKALHDVLGAPYLSVMPADGYTSLCECELCKGKSTPEYGYHGLLSDYVWGYVNKVAKELHKTHPKMRVGCSAYGTYLTPPGNIKQFSPNVVITLCQHRQNYYDKNEYKAVLESRNSFIGKLPAGGKIMINDKYRSGDHKPMFFPHIIAEDLKSLKGISLGGKYEVFRDTKGGIDWLAAMHLNLYVTSLFWWDADQDIEALLSDYYTKFYGPAAAEMKEFIEYSEKNWADTAKDVVKMEKVLSLIKKAVDKVEPESVYGKRIAFVYNSCCQN